MSGLLGRTLREAPADAEVASHRLLLRAGYIRRVSAGVYTLLPLGLRVVERVLAIVREELEVAGAQELAGPHLHPAELWERSGRDRLMADVLLRVDGKGGAFVLGPTAEEVVTVTVGAEVESYRDLPVTVFQVQTKFRDEARPRFGLLRTREFLMNDAYSFDESQEAMATSYRRMYDAYHRIFGRCGLDVTPVEADAGAMGGSVNHEFMVVSPIGEDHVARCRCGYAANREAAEAGARRPDPGPAEPLVEHHTPGAPGIEAVVGHFADRGLTAARMLKCIAFVAPDGSPVVALVPGDREVLAGRLGPGVRPFDEADFLAHPDLVRGYIGPVGLADLGVRVVADHAVRAGGPWVTGANRSDHHVSGATLGRDFEVGEWASIASVAPGDPCPRCGAGLELVRAVEAGHTFQLGTRYSESLGAGFLDAAGTERPFWMGCYGIGVSRLLAVVAERHHDDDGLVWPAAVAPFDIHVVALGGDRNPEVREAADVLERVLVAAGRRVLHDDRDLSAGVKFADADLIGVPVQLVVGARGLGRGIVERKDRRTGTRDELPLDGVVAGLESVP